MLNMKGTTGRIRSLSPKTKLADDAYTQLAKIGLELNCPQGLDTLGALRLGTFRSALWTGEGTALPQEAKPIQPRHGLHNIQATIQSRATEFTVIVGPADFTGISIEPRNEHGLVVMGELTTEITGEYLGHIFDIMADGPIRIEMEEKQQTLEDMVA